MNLAPEITRNLELRAKLDAMQTELRGILPPMFQSLNMVNFDKKENLLIASLPNTSLMSAWVFQRQHDKALAFLYEKYPNMAQRQTRLVCRVRDEGAVQAAVQEMKTKPAPTNVAPLTPEKVRAAKTAIAEIRKILRRS
jgi:hypothetical protein